MDGWKNAFVWGLWSERDLISPLLFLSAVSDHRHPCNTRGTAKIIDKISSNLFFFSISRYYNFKRDILEIHTVLGSSK